MGLPEAGLLEDKGTAEGSAGESADKSLENFGYTLPFSWLDGRSVRGLGGDFTCLSGAGSRLFWLQREGHGGEAGLAMPLGSGAVLSCWTVGRRLLGARVGSMPGASSHAQQVESHACTCAHTHTCTRGPTLIHTYTHIGPTS